jgi:hypothetical protein
MHQKTIKDQETKITELESLLAAAYDELEEKDEVILEIYEKYQQIKNSVSSNKNQKL